MPLQRPVRHDKVLRFRVSADLTDKIRAAAEESEMSVSAFLRSAARDRAESPDPVLGQQLIEELVELRGQIGRFGNVLNQMARHLNQGGSLKDGTEAQLVQRVAAMHRRV